MDPRRGFEPRLTKSELLSKALHRFTHARMAQYSPEAKIYAPFCIVPRPPERPMAVNWSSA